MSVKILKGLKFQHFPSGTKFAYICVRWLKKELKRLKKAIEGKMAEKARR
mgnify:CR=1 FL=1|jgi:hypothetical protein